MGGKGSGRPPKPETLIKRQQFEKRQPIATEMFIPNLSGLGSNQDAKNFLNSSYLAINGSNANQNINIGSYDLTTTGDITGGSLNLSTNFTITDNGSGQITITTATSNQDLLFSVNDGGILKTVMYLDSSYPAVRILGNAKIMSASNSHNSINLYDSSGDMILHSANAVKINSSDPFEVYNMRIGGSTNYVNFDGHGDLEFFGDSGFYPAVLNQATKPAAGTGDTEVDAGEMKIWTDTDDSKCYICYNHGGTVKTVELT